VRGTMQVSQVDGRSWLEASSTSVLRLLLPEETGDSFSIEFRVLVPAANIGLTLYPAPRETAIRSYPHDYFNVSARPGVYRGGNELSAVYSPRIVEKPLQVRIQYDDGVLIMYVDSERVAMVPNANIPSSSVLEFHLEGNARFHTLLDDVVVALDVDDLYDALVNDGGFTTRGILFDFDSDRLRPESTPVLTELADALGRAPAMKVAILGHTDSQGADDYNRDLSERRAATVMAWLVARGITADRLTAVGMGEAEPVASNDTPEGQAENRRVEVRVTG
jgi:outer membrane protein OmpA-like peptidoglycan-associated protein